MNFHDVTYVQSQEPHRIRISASFSRSPSVMAILDETAVVFGVRRESILADRRSRYVVRARWVAMLAARRLTKQSFPQIARHFKRDHTSIIHGVRMGGDILDGKWWDKYDGEDFCEKYAQVLAAFGRV